MARAYEYPGRITRVVDGDTVWAELDLGFRVRLTLCLRLLGIDAPETRGEQREAGERAKSFAESWAAAHPAVVVRTYRDRADKYGRYLAVVMDPEPEHEPGRNPHRVLNDALVESGMATRSPVAA